MHQKPLLSCPLPTAVAFLNGMKRIFYTATILTLAMLVWPCVSYAQNVQMRTGIHANYSRLVVDWPSKTSQTIKKQGQTLTITFDKAANPNATNVDTAKSRNINNVKVSKTDPLTITVQMLGENRHRSFYAGNRFVLDIYNLPGTKPTNVAAVKPKPAPPKKFTPAKEPKPAPTPTPAQETKPLKDVVKEARTAKVEPVEKEQLIETDKQEPEFAQLENPGLQSASLIALGSTQPTGIAVFERGDKIYIVNDDPDLLIRPKVSGPDSNYLLPLDTTTTDAAKIFTANRQIGSLIRTQGGGLLWKVIVSGIRSKEEAIEPVRKDVVEGDFRSGKLVIPFEEPGKTLEIPDPITGSNLIIVTSKTSKDFTGQRRTFPEFDILESAAGLAILSRVDDLEVKIKEAGVEISRPGGLAILAQSRVNRDKAMDKVAQSQTQNDTKRIFDFKNWSLGGIDAIRENKNILLSNASQLPDSERDAALMSLAKMYLANGMGAEALGFLYMIENYNQDIANTAEFRAIRGAANALDYKTENAFNDMAIQDLDQFEEIGFWKAYALADIGDWQQAIEVLPASANILYDYPDQIMSRLGLVTAEVALRAGNTTLATDILRMLEDQKDILNDPQIAALHYLQGELSRQQGNIEQAIKDWKPLIEGIDDLYRAKAGLALMRLKIDEERIEPKDAIDTLERLRYAWRGDELEARIGYWLGRTYFEAGKFVRGLNLMREGATVAAGTNFGGRITNEMTDILTELYLSEALDSVSPLDAVTLYDQFSELIPSGETGDKVVERLADRLTAADLLGRAANLLSYQLNHRLDGFEAYNVAVKLAAIYLLDSKAPEALEVLDIAQVKFDTLPQDIQTPDKIQDMTLLRARALSRNGRPDQGIKMLEGLNNNPTTNRLRADIAWTAGYWDDAASALGDVIIDQNISLTRPLSEDHTTLILHRAISLNLASDRIGLANMREKYTDSMAQTEKARIFEVITRPRQNAALADRETMLGIVSEVDLFSDFLESYKAVSAPSN